MSTEKRADRSAARGSRALSVTSAGTSSVAPTCPQRSSGVRRARLWRRHLHAPPASRAPRACDELVNSEVVSQYTGGARASSLSGGLLPPPSYRRGSETVFAARRRPSLRRPPARRGALSVLCSRVLSGALGCSRAISSLATSGNLWQPRAISRSLAQSRLLAAQREGERDSVHQAEAAPATCSMCMCMCMCVAVACAREHEHAHVHVHVHDHVHVRGCGVREGRGPQC